MSKRLQVTLDDREFERFKRLALEEQVSLAEWVRRILNRHALRRSNKPAVDKLRALHDALGHNSPSMSIEQMNAEIEQGYPTRLP